MLTELKVVLLVFLLVGCAFVRSISEECYVAVEVCEVVESCDEGR